MSETVQTWQEEAGEALMSFAIRQDPSATILVSGFF